MSLTTDLANKDSRVSQFMRSRLSNTQDFLKGARRQMRESTIQLLPHTSGSIGKYPYSAIGTAIDYRIRYYFAVTPYEDLVAYRGAKNVPEIAAPLSSVQMFFPDSVSVSVWRSADRIEFRDKLTGGWLGTHFPDPEKPSFVADDSMMMNAITDAVEHIGAGLDEDSAVIQGSICQEFFSCLDNLTQSLQPQGRRLATEEEDQLNRFCIILGLFEPLARQLLLPSRSQSIPSHLLGPLADREFTSVNELLDIVELDRLADMRELSWAFHDQCSHLLSLPHTLNPTFEGSSDVGGADADLIVDGTLIDIKTTIKPEIDNNWLWQLLGYTLLDYSDECGINAIALYMARQGLYLRWDLEEALRGLCGEHPPSLEELRAELKGVLQTK